MSIQEELYQARLAAELCCYNDCIRVHDLPAVSHYWSNRYLLPKLKPFGFNSPEEMFKKYLGERCGQRQGHAKRFVSVGAGNCDLEISLALYLRDAGYTGFVIDCLDLNESMLERGRVSAAENGVSKQIHCVQMDFNQWAPAQDYDAVIANQTLHHVVNLEGLFAQIQAHLKPGGCFVISDMIGRNGHRRWPEALAIVREFWQQLPPSYRYNRQLERYDENFEDWDCSEGNFEGIRSQDILPLLLSHFHFRLFIGFANIIDPFLDRSFGHNFDPAADWDRAFIDAVHQRDEAETAAGRIKPTHMLAVVGNDPVEPAIFQGNLSPQFCVRPVNASEEPSAVQENERAAYRWESWPHSLQSELEIACRRLTHAAQQQTELNKEVQQRTLWAKKRDEDLLETAHLYHQLRKEIDTERAHSAELTKELHRTKLVRRMYRAVLKLYHLAGG